MNLKRAARLENAVDVTLVGHADLDYWIAKLRPEMLTPISEDGRAQVLIIAAEGVFWSQTFRELSVSILARPLDRPEQRMGAFLVQAYNSNRFFAFCERRFFKTPYETGAITVEVDGRIGFSVVSSSGETMRCSKRENVTLDSAIDQSWGGPVYLPSADQTAAQKKKAFVAAIDGRVTVVPFGDGDQFELSDRVRDGAIEQLESSRFEPVAWRIRPQAVHEKSKTYTWEQIHQNPWTDGPGSMW